jgi:uncharacterized hydrophobic protein (TIGR00271 family)
MKTIGIVIKLFRYLRLDTELDDFETIHNSIEKDVVFKGTNLWILMFAIVVASVGLNMNSTAVIIGAMLISPLMGPINGMGYSIATYNFPLFRKAVRNFSFAVVTSLVASTTYFALSPISTAHSELLARTSPTIYDVLIAFFGGLAGIVAITSRQKGNVIPGVAIATALMPPLCTAGYGLATLQFDFFLGALYLFTINTVFIALASVAISQMLEFPIWIAVEDDARKRINRWISVVIVIVFVPSIYFGYKLVQKEKFTGKANKYLANIGMFEGNYLLKGEINADKRQISLLYMGRNLSDDQKKRIIDMAADFDISDSKIEIREGVKVNETSIENVENDKLKNELIKMKMVLQQRDNQLNSIYLMQTMSQKIFNEINALYPQIESCSYAEAYTSDKDGGKAGKSQIIIFTSQSAIDQKEKEKIQLWLQTRLNSLLIKVFYE